MGPLGIDENFVKKSKLTDDSKLQYCVIWGRKLAHKELSWNKSNDLCTVSEKTYIGGMTMRKEKVKWQIKLSDPNLC